MASGNLTIGYARVSTHEQNLDMQIDELKKMGCKKIISDKISGSVAERPGLSELLNQLREGDTLVVWRLDRLGRTLRHLIKFIKDLEDEGIHFKSIKESIDTRTSTGKLIFHIFGALSEFEKNLVGERTKAGLEAARARGRLGGRPKKLNPSKRKLAVDLYNSKKHSVAEICETVGVSRPTLYKYISEKSFISN